VEEIERGTTAANCAVREPDYLKGTRQYKEVKEQHTNTSVFFQLDLNNFCVFP
jgi:hypothetical protein